jgi:hypothetical protein
LWLLLLILNGRVGFILLLEFLVIVDFFPSVFSFTITDHKR